MFFVQVIELIPRHLAMQKCQPTIYIPQIPSMVVLYLIFNAYGCTVRSHFATVRFKTIHIYDPCPVGPSTPNLWCITVATQPSFLYLVRF